MKTHRLSLLLAAIVTVAMAVPADATAQAGAGAPDPAVESNEPHQPVPEAPGAQDPGTLQPDLDAAAQTPRVVRETELDRQVKEVASQLRCVVCQGTSIQDSPSTLAQEMRGVVREQLAAGRTPEEVFDYFVERYGEWVLLRPKASGVNLLVYLLPVAAIVGGAAFVYLKARKWTNASAAAGQAAATHETVVP